MLNLQVERLKQLPQRLGETWQGGLVRLPGWVTGEGDQPVRPMTAMWVSVETGKVRMSEEACREEDVTFGMAVDALVRLATDELICGYRPGRLETNDPALAEHLSGLLADANIRVEERQDLPALEACLDDLAKHLFDGGPSPPGYLQVNGVTVERVRAFAEAAKRFYEAAPWRHLSNEDLIEIEQPQPGPAFRCVVVLGAGGQEFGLAFYRSADVYWASRDLKDPDEQLAARGGAWCVFFEDIVSVPLADADLWEDEGLPVAGGGAYPVAVQYARGGRLLRPDAGELSFFEGLLRALAATTEGEMDSGRWTKEVTTFDGPGGYSLRLPFLLKPPGHQELFRHGIVDRRAMERLNAEMDRFMEDHEFESVEELNEAIQREFVGKPASQLKHKPRNAMEEAQDLCYQAFDFVGRRRIVLARQAIELWPDCADAYVLLAEHATTPAEAVELYAAGVEAGRRGLGEAFFEENSGQFWGITGTRPLMRAVKGLAECQSDLGKIDEAIADHQELLRLNPGDNQGVRYLLLPLLIAEGQTDEAGRLLEEYRDDPQATWLYSRALVTFCKEGNGSTARGELGEAIKANRHVPRYLLGEAEVEDWPDGYQLGSREEAIICADAMGRTWAAVPGALAWLRKQTAGRTTGRRRRRPPRPKRK